MTKPPNTPRVHVTLTLQQLDDPGAVFRAWLRAEPADGGADGFGVAGAVPIHRRIGRDEWEALGSPVVLPITLHNVAPDVTP